MHRGGDGGAETRAGHPLLFHRTGCVGVDHVEWKGRKKEGKRTGRGKRELKNGKRFLIMLLIDKIIINDNGGTEDTSVFRTKIEMKRVSGSVSFVMLGLWGVSLLLPGCSAAEESVSSEVTSPTTAAISAATALPTLALDETSSKDFVISEFDTMHTVDEADANKFLIFGNIEVEQPAAGLPDELTAFLGRWEGYGYGPPVRKDRKLVLVITEINQQGGKAFAWSGTNLQYPDMIEEIQFRVIAGKAPSLEWQMRWADGSEQIVTFTYEGEKEILKGWTKVIEGKSSNNSPYELTRERSFYVYEDYAAYLESKRITTKTYQNSALSAFGKGYMVYLPEGYEESPDKSWPLLFFLHGYGDRGENLMLLAKASPFMYIREKGALPMIIAAPILSDDLSPAFPDEYMEGVLAEIQSEYRVDAQRIYMTGLSMGGEATWRFAINQPQTFAAIAPLCSYLDHATLEMMKKIKDLSVWVIHGADDKAVPVYAGQALAVGLAQVGGNVRFSLLEGHDHDVWTDTYSDAAFYDWLLGNQRP